MEAVRIKSPDGLVVPDELIKCADLEARRDGMAMFFADYHLLQYAIPLMRDIDYVVSRDWDFIPISVRYISASGLVQVVPGVRTLARSNPGGSLMRYDGVRGTKANHITGDTIINMPLQLETLVFCRQTEDNDLVLAGLVTLKSDESLYTAHSIGFFVD